MRRKQTPYPKGAQTPSQTLDLMFPSFIRMMSPSFGSLQPQNGEGPQGDRPEGRETSKGLIEEIDGLEHSLLLQRTQVRSPHTLAHNHLLTTVPG